jgi:hypothetical protein
LGASIESLWRAEPPWTATWPATRDQAQELVWQLQSAGAVARVLRGSKMTTLDGFFGEIGAALQFPAYFGENWDALNECLTDMLWLRGPAYVLVVTDANLLFRDDKRDSLPTLLKIADFAGESWAAAADEAEPWGHGSVPFHLVLAVEDAAVEAWHRRLARAGIDIPDREFEKGSAPDSTK